jgi:hypothetical protein
LAAVKLASGGDAVHRKPVAFPLTVRVVGVPEQIVAGGLIDKSLGAIRIMLGCVTVEKASDIESV